MAIYATQFKIADDEGRTTNREVLFDVADEAALIVAANLFVTDLQAIMNAGIVNYTYRRTVDVNNVPAVGSNIDTGFTTLWATALAIDPTTKVPTPINAIKDGQGGINLANLLVIAWLENYTIGDARVNINNPQQPTAVRRATLDK